MNRYGLKAASRQCLADAAIPPRRIVCFYLLCLYVILIPTDIYSHILQTNFAALSGLSAITLKNRYFLLSVIITVLVLIFTFLWGVGFSAYALRLSRKERAGADDLFTGFRMFGKLLWLDVLMAIYVALWLFVFIIPGFIALYRYRMAVYVLLDHPDYTASQALRESCVLTDGHKWELFKLDLSFLWYYLLSVLCVNSLYLYTHQIIALSGTAGYLVSYFIGIAGSVILDLCCLAYLQCTYAHCYNWLCMEASSRWQGGRYSSDPYRRA